MDEIMSRQLTRKQTQVLEAMVAGPTPSAKKGRFSYKIVSGDNRAENVVSVLKGQLRRVNGRGEHVNSASLVAVIYFF